MYLGDADTHGTETLDIDLGWAANGGSGTYDAVDADGLGNFGVMNGDAFANPSISCTAGNVIPFSGILSAVSASNGGFPYFTKKTLVRPPASPSRKRGPILGSQLKCAASSIRPWSSANQ